ncbi:MAG: sodium/solute symporter [Sedimentisphaeraceae bacterium JB056]
MEFNLGFLDTSILFLYAAILVGMGVYYCRKTKTADEFMVAGRSIPAWAAGIAVMSAYTSSISYIAVPGKAYDSNWHPLVFVLCIPPVAWLVTKYVIPYYRREKLISVFSFLEGRLGPWARIYAALSFVIYMIGRAAVIIYLASLLLTTFVPWDIRWVIIVIGIITVVYTLLGGMEAVIWTDVMQSIIMVGGLVFCVVMLSKSVLSGSEPLINKAVEANKFALGEWDFSFSSRTVWVMIIYSLTENLRNLVADQNYVQKYCSVADEKAAKRSLWISMAIYIPLTPVFLYIGTALFSYYGGDGNVLPAEITKGDQVFPYFIATQLPIGIKGLMIAAILAAAMSTIDSALNCSATVLFIDFMKRFFAPNIGERQSVNFLRLMTVVWGILGIAFALLMIKARSALEIWWQISGIFGGGILGLFILGFCRSKLKLWQGLVAILVSIVLISWITFGQGFDGSMECLKCSLDPIMAGVVGVVSLVIVGLLFGFFNKKVGEVTA